LSQNFDTDISVLANTISVLAYRYRLSAKGILAISVLAKYQLKNLDIAQNIGKHIDIGFCKNIGIGKYIGSEKISVSAQPI
jgi:hypothetical protein